MLKSIELSGFKSFGRKSELVFSSPIAAIVGPNGSGKSNVAEAFRFVLGEQSMKSLRSKRGEDLLWGGSSGLPRTNRASVKVIFDNASKALDIDFPEVVIERVVNRDGVNEYSINGSSVRLKDITQLLSQANIGSSGYHIISQGEADRVLSASARERREMVEEALGLKAYQSKKTESEKKLEETDQNLHEVKMLRREIAPHLKYLQKQVEKIERAKELQKELGDKLSDYLSRENAYLNKEFKDLSESKKSLESELIEIEREIDEMQAKLSVQKMDSVDGGVNAELQDALIKLGEASSKKEDVSRELGRAEGELSAFRASAGGSLDVPVSINREDVQVFIVDLEKGVSLALASRDIDVITEALSSVKERIRLFKSEINEGLSEGPQNSMVEQAAARVENLLEEFARAQREEVEFQNIVKTLREKESEGRETFHATERALLEVGGKQREMVEKLNRIKVDIVNIENLRERFNEEVREGIVLLGGEHLSYESIDIGEDAFSEDRSIQEDRRRKIERIKIKIEEYRGTDADDVLKEYTETEKRDEFLAREVEDLEKSAESLRSIIADLDESIGERFESGLSLIQKEFNTFFVQLFGGGSASLELEKARQASDTEEEAPAGLSVSVQLPRKRVAGLEVLSGGERALTSIALIFAMSQVNPPPFLILDETDAALDEANSRRYAQIVEMLAKRSQLILITHNRATMAAAGELYGVTMGQDGVSKLLSVKLEEAQKVAK